jgi:tRNA-Thr(GGU) m(6)t(6)A37 methyltransferase TsaA
MQINPIAQIQSSYKEKFGTPRQSGLIHSDRSEVVLNKEFHFEDYFRGLEDMSHIWLIFGFHQAEYKEGQTTVRPPRLGGKERMGIFACRTPHRPNQLGLSLVKIESIDKDKIQISGSDLVHGTPIYDIKPYHPQADRPENYHAGYIEQLPKNKLEVRWVCEKPALLMDHIEEVLIQDPRPSFHKEQNEVREYGVLIENFNVRFRLKENIAEVLEVELIPDL